MSTTELLAAIDAYFAFKPGDIVVQRATLEAMKIERDLNTKMNIRHRRVGAPRSGYVLTRNLEQCHGGVQGFYTVCERNDEGMQIQTRYADHAVVSMAEAVAVLKESITDDASEAADDNAWLQAATRLTYRP